MISSSINNLVKVSLIGHPAVGKTTILKLLSEKIINKIYLPTQGFDLKTVEFDGFRLKIWDFGGQKSYLNLYLKDYLVGSDMVLIVTDSSSKNVFTSRALIDIADEIVGANCPIIAIANKQDLVKQGGHLTVEKVEHVLDVKTYGLTAIKSAERIKLMNILKKELNKVVMRKR
jgi:small GTP-binding protein